MAIEADRVVVALIGDTSNLDTSARRSAQTFDRSMTTIEQSATRAEKQIVVSSGRIANAQRNMGRQIADIGTQLAGGQSPFIILAQQLPQVADAATDMGGKFGKVASFLTTPWGAAALAAASVLVPLAAGLFKTGNEVDALVEKMRKQARQSELNDEALRRFEASSDGVSRAIREQKKALDELADADKTAAERANATAIANLEKAVAIREAAVAAAEAARQEAGQFAVGITGTAGASEAQIAGAARRAAAAEEKAAQAEKDLATARENLANTRGALGVEQANRAAAAAATEQGRITDAYERQKKAIEDKAAAEIRATNELKKQQQIANRLAVDLLKLQKARDREIKKAQAQERDARRGVDPDSVPFQRPVQGGTIRGTVGERRPGHTHAGVDIAVPVGTRVNAAAPGTVIESGTLPGYGNVVIIDHGRGTVTRYAHLSKLGVQKGDTVGAGDLIGLSGGARGAPGSGNSQGPHLHYEVRRNGRPVNPNGSFPIDPATARKVRNTIEDDFVKLYDQLASGADDARDKIASDFNSLQDSMDPAAAIARDLNETIDKIAKANLIGLIDDAKAAELQFLATHKASADLLGTIIDIEGLKAGAAIEKDALDEAEQKRKDAEDRIQAQREDNIYDLADLYETLFSGGTLNLWDEFKRQGIRALALLAAQETFQLITGNKVSLGGRGGGSLIGSIIGSIIPGFANGTNYAPGGLSLVGERGPELVNIPRGSQVLPNHLLSNQAASPAQAVTKVFNISVSADNSVTPAGFARGLAAEILQEAHRMDVTTANGTLRSIPSFMAKQNRYG